MATTVCITNLKIPLSVSPWSIYFVKILYRLKIFLTSFKIKSAISETRLIFKIRATQQLSKNFSISNNLKPIGFQLGQLNFDD